MQMVMLVIDNPAHLEAVLEAWQSAGVTGATVIESSGLFRVRQRRPMTVRYALGALRHPAPISMEHYTLLAIVPDAATANACLTAAEGVVGDLNEPNTGVFAAWDLTAVKGLPAPGTGGEGAR